MIIGQWDISNPGVEDWLAVVLQHKKVEMMVHDGYRRQVGSSQAHNHMPLSTAKLENQTNTLHNMVLQTATNRCRCDMSITLVAHPSNPNIRFQQFVVMMMMMHSPAFPGVPALPHSVPSGQPACTAHVHEPTQEDAAKGLSGGCVCKINSAGSYDKLLTLPMKHCLTYTCLHMHSQSCTAWS